MLPWRSLRCGNRSSRRIFCAAGAGADHALLAPPVVTTAMGSSASRLGGCGQGQEGPALPRAAGTRAHDPRHGSSHVRKAPGSAVNPTAITTCLAGYGRSSRRPSPPVALHAHHGQRAAGLACPPAGTGLPSRLRRDPPPHAVTVISCAGLWRCDESFACDVLWDPAW